MDEVLATYDTEAIIKNNKTRLTNILIDDDIHDWLLLNKSQKIYFFVDACNSGTSYRSINLSANGNSSLNLKSDAIIKFLSYKNMPKLSHLSSASALSSGDDAGINDAIKQKYNDLPNLVFLAAAKDSEFALATNKGSVFTIGLSSIIENALLNSEPLTPQILHDKLTLFIKHKIQNEKIPGVVHHPQLNSAFALKRLTLFSDHLMDNSTQIEYQPLPLLAQNTSQKLAQQIAINSFDNSFNFIVKKALPLMITRQQESINLGDNLIFDIEIPQNNWFLNVVYIGTDGSMEVLFPNQFSTNNQLSKGKITIPDKNMPFDIRAIKPLGKSYVYAFLTQEYVDFYQDSTDGFDVSGQANAIFSGVSAKATRSLRVNSNYYAGSFSVDIN
jgi:hypothetical protein